MSLDINQLRESLRVWGSSDSMSAYARDIKRAVKAIVDGEFVPRGQPIRWCTTHDAQAFEYCWRAAWADPIPADAKPRCRIVDGYLTLP